MMTTFLFNKEAAQHSILAAAKNPPDLPEKSTTIRVQLLIVHKIKAAAAPSMKSRFSASSRARAKLQHIVCASERVIGCHMVSMKQLHDADDQQDCCHSTRGKPV